MVLCAGRISDCGGTRSTKNERRDRGKADVLSGADMPGPGFAAGPCLLKDTMQLAAFNQNKFVLGHAAMIELPSFEAFDTFDNAVRSLKLRKFDALAKRFVVDAKVFVRSEEIFNVGALDVGELSMLMTR